MTAPMEPIAHNNDPGTSHLAAGHMEESGKLSAHQRLVLDMVERDPGCTCAELAKLNEGRLRQHSMDILMLVRRRVTDLVRKGWCYYGPRTSCAVMGNTAGTVWPVEGDKQ
ncbi:hypothetical protein [Halofilum ochraceum]|uniref:hypothetical protein n=1 Tax=Halofilum ochraceum TaxID=1611323 RepID=UPI0008DA8169|nr:hypothetical protein [Halofilum ochraceum]